MALLDLPARTEGQSQRHLARIAKSHLPCHLLIRKSPSAVDAANSTRPALDRYSVTSSRRFVLRSISLITATLAAPARQQSVAVSIATPPIATTGREVALHAFASSSRPRASLTPALVGLSNTGPN